VSRAPPPPGGRHRRHGGLFRRIYLHSLLLLLLVALAMAIVGFALRRDGGWHTPHGAVVYAAERVAELRGDPQRLAAELARVREALGFRATVRDPAGAVIASSAQPPLPALDPDDRARLARGPVRFPVHGVALAAPLPGGGYLLVESAHPSPDLSRAAISIGAVLLALALGSIPLARSIASPVEQLTRAARALGEGDLRARANVRAKGEVGELARAFDEMAGRLERLVHAEKELLANVSHELRTPLARIRVALELGAEGDLDKARRFLAEIGEDLDALDRLLADVLTAARLDLAAPGAGLALRRAPVHPAALVDEVAARFQTDHPDRVLEARAADALPALDGDASLLARLLQNLVDNARKYSDAPAPVALEARADGAGVLFEVRDRGIGIPPGDFPRLFTPFFRSDRSRARGTGGVGLGLALAKRIAAAHGGTIDVTSAPGAGTTVRVRLPAARPA
jgi:two-component system OmpR family sensor kinase